MRGAICIAAAALLGTYNCGPSDGRLPSFAFRGQQYSPPPIPQFSPPAITNTTCQRTGNTVSCQSY